MSHSCEYASPSFRHAQYTSTAARTSYNDTITNKKSKKRHDTNEHGRILSR
jgi:hypothetical protein